MAKTAVIINETIQANARVNVLAGKRFENVSNTGFLLLAQTGSADGLTSELFVGTRNALESSPVGGTNRVPQIPEDVVVDEVDSFQGEKIQLNVVNTTTGDLTYNAKLILDDNVTS